ncbi:MAG: heavy-metal-associated domain-containing protein [Bacteroidetes bacterium]|nr:heavy-metal-associated domain-containing protein [Bacteroidota bacterium]
MKKELPAFFTSSPLHFFTSSPPHFFTSSLLHFVSSSPLHFFTSSPHHTMTQIKQTFPVTGMTCASCVLHVEKA